MRSRFSKHLSELNYKLLNTSFLFKPGSKLRDFLLEKGGIINKKYHLLLEIMIGLKDIIKEEILFDIGNPRIILCSPSLEDSLNRKAVHVSEIRNEVLKHLIIASHQPMLKKILIGQRWMSQG